jgi:hypothetical protein
MPQKLTGVPPCTLWPPLEIPTFPSLPVITWAVPWVTTTTRSRMQRQQQQNNFHMKRTKSKPTLPQRRDSQRPPKVPNADLSATKEIHKRFWCGEAATDWDTSDSRQRQRGIPRSVEKCELSFDGSVSDTVDCCEAHKKLPCL